MEKVSQTLIDPLPLQCRSSSVPNHTRYMYLRRGGAFSGQIRAPQPLEPDRIYTIAIYTGEAGDTPGPWLATIKAVLCPESIECEDTGDDGQKLYRPVDELVAEETFTITNDAMAQTSDAMAQTDATVWVELTGTGADGKTVTTGRRVIASATQDTSTGHAVYNHHGKMGCHPPGTRATPPR